MKGISKNGTDQNGVFHLIFPCHLGFRLSFQHKFHLKKAEESIVNAYIGDFKAM